VLRAFNEAPEQHPEWVRATTLSTFNLWATPEQLESLVAAVRAVLEEQVAPASSSRLTRQAR
jgi:hypothetical protein